MLLDHYWLPDSVVWLNKGYMVRHLHALCCFVFVWTRRLCCSPLRANDGLSLTLLCAMGKVGCVWQLTSPHISLFRVCGPNPWKANIWSIHMPYRQAHPVLYQDLLRAILPFLFFWMIAFLHRAGTWWTSHVFAKFEGWTPKTWRILISKNRLYLCTLV